ncbi:DUF4351 domain-containing protein [Clostridium sp.]|jgi:hypothetical protein|uniref:DUF4351 domain-containing protein n=1 Tax=Clostridium sp. TaxID=1506 RepID=UPI003EED11A6
MEFLERLKDIIINFNSLTSEEKLLLKGWIKNTTNNNDIVDMNKLVENIFNNEMEVEAMVSNASNIFDKFKKEAIKEGLDVGKKEDLKEGKSELLLKPLIKRFNGLSDYYIEKIKKLLEESIELLATNIFELEKIDDIKKYL